MAKSDDILKKYGISQVRGSEGKTGENAQKSSSHKETNVKSTKADTILAKYGISQVRNAEGNLNATANAQIGSAQNWVNSSVAHLKNAEDYFKTWRGKDDTGYATLRKKNSSLLAEAYNLRNQYSDDKDATEYIEEVIAALQNAGSSFKKYSDYYGQWETEDDYNKWLQYSTPEVRQEQYEKNQARLQELKNQQLAIMYQPGTNPYTSGSEAKEKARQLNEEIAALKKEIQLYEYGEVDDEGNYYGYKVADDYSKYLKDNRFVEAAKNRTYKNATRSEMDAYDAAQSDASTALSNGGYYDDEGNIRNARGEVVQTATAAPVVQDKLGLFLSASDEDVAEAYNILSASDGNYDTTWADIMQEGDTHRWKYLKEDELQIYYGLLRTEGQEAAYKYLDAMEVELGRRENTAMQEYVDASSGWQQFGVVASSLFDE